MEVVGNVMVGVIRWINNIIIDILGSDFDEHVSLYDNTCVVSSILT